MEEGIVYKAGSLEFKILFTPGHTPACTTILVGKYAFTGDALFKPDVGTGRCDFPGGSAEDLYDSVHEKLYKLPEDTVFCSGHDYPPEGRKENAYSTMDEQRLGNKQLKQSTTKDEYVDFRKARDATLSAPKLIYPSLQVNIDAGSLPKEEDNNKSYMKVPINKKGDL